MIDIKLIRPIWPRQKCSVFFLATDISEPSINITEAGFYLNIKGVNSAKYLRHTW